MINKNTHTMKKLFLPLLMIAIASFTGCGNNLPANNTETENATTTPSNIETDNELENNDELENDELVEHNNTDEQNSGSIGTLQDFMSGKLGTNMKCEFEHKVGKDDTLYVTSFIAGDKIYVEYALLGKSLGWRNAGSAQKTLYILSDGEYSYIWGNSFLGGMMDGMKYKITMDDTGEIEKPDSEMTPGMIDYKMPMINCNPWTPNYTFFEMPEGLSFVDINSEEDVEELFTETYEGGEIDIEDLLEEDPADPCVGCGFLPDSMKEACYGGCQ